MWARSEMWAPLLQSSFCVFEIWIGIGMVDPAPVASRAERTPAAQPREDRSSMWVKVKHTHSGARSSLSSVQISGSGFSNFKKGGQTYRKFEPTAAHRYCPLLLPSTQPASALFDQRACLLFLLSALAMNLTLHSETCENFIEGKHKNLRCPLSHHVHRVLSHTVPLPHSKQASKQALSLPQSFPAGRFTEQGWARGARSGH